MDDMETLFRMVERAAKRRNCEVNIGACVGAFALCVGLAAAGTYFWSAWPGLPVPHWPFWPQVGEMVGVVLVAAFSGFLAFAVAGSLANSIVREVRAMLMRRRANALRREAGL